MASEGLEKALCSRIVVGTAHEDDMKRSVKEASAFVNNLELPPRPRHTRNAPSAASVDLFDVTKSQAMVVGSDIVSFIAGIAPELRSRIVQCSLLAQLAANKKAPSRSEIRAWYEAYFDTLTHVGWVVQERGFSEHKEAGDNFEAEKAILAIAETVLGPAATALAIITSTLEAMKSMADGRWFTVFSRESQSAKAARFQMTVAEPGVEGGASISLMAFELVAKRDLTQVLFFKFNASEVTLRHASGRVTIDGELLAAIGPAISQKVSAYTQSFIQELPI